MRMTPKQPGGNGGPFGGYQASCPFHRKNDTTGCKRYLKLPSNDPAARQLVLRQLMWWCSQAKNFSRQRFHLIQGLPTDQVPSWAHLRALREDVRPEKGEVHTDEYLDAEDAASVAASAAYTDAGRASGSSLVVAPRCVSVVLLCVSYLEL